MRISSYDMTLVLRIWAWLFAFSGFVVYFFYGLSLLHLPLALVCLAVAAAISLFVSWGGKSLGGLIYLGSAAPLSVDQKLAPELDKIRHYYRKTDYRKAQDLIRNILSEHPEHGETLIWKAKVVLATDGDVQVAGSILRKVLREEQNDKAIRSWAVTLLEESRVQK